MLITFVVTALTTLNIGAIVLMTHSVTGGVIAQSWALYIPGCFVNAILGAAYAGGFGQKLPDARGRRWRFDWPRYAEKKIYLPWGGGLSWKYPVFAVVGVANNGLWDFCAIRLTKLHEPVSMSTFFGWASGCWLALGGLLELRSGFEWRKLGAPAAGMFQLAGIAVTVGLLYAWGLDGDALSNPLVLVMASLSLSSAGLVVAMKRLKAREVERFRQTEGEPTKRDQRFLSGKVMAYPSAARSVLGGVAFCAAGVVDEFPRVTDWKGVALSIGLLIIAALGGRASALAYIEGNQSLNGVGGTAGLGFSFWWTWVFQRIGISVEQAIGSLMAFAGAMAAALSHRDVRMLLGLTRSRDRPPKKP